MNEQPKTERTLDANSPIDALEILKMVIYSRNCNLPGDLFRLVDISLDTLQAEIMRAQAGAPTTHTGTEGGL